MSAQPHRHLPGESYFAQYAALYGTIAAFAVVTLIVQQVLWQNGRWLIYIVGVIAFALIADRGTQGRDTPSWQAVTALTTEGILVVGLTLLSDYFFMTAMLSFISVAIAEGMLPRRSALIHHALLLLALIVVFVLGSDVSTALQIGLGLPAGFVFIIAFTQLAQRERQARQQLEAANIQLTEYAAQVEQLATMRERNRLAREVHDSLGHYLTVINVQLEVVTKLLEANPSKALEAAKRAKELASEGLSEVRRSVAALRPSPIEDRPLPEALQGLADTAREAGLVVTFEQDGRLRALSPEVETVIYRATQEALTNIRKHAHASSAHIRLAYAPTTVQLCIRDNGVGRHHDEDNVGLAALRERTAALNGTVVAENHPAGGFQIEVTLPT
jgi:signal transduction histidine kinase